jgi:hypothetical protein
VGGERGGGADLEGDKEVLPGGELQEAHSGGGDGRLQELDELVGVRKAEQDAGAHGPHADKDALAQLLQVVPHAHLNVVRELLLVREQERLQRGRRLQVAPRGGRQVRVLPEVRGQLRAPHHLRSRGRHRARTLCARDTPGGPSPVRTCRAESTQKSMVIYLQHKAHGCENPLSNVLSLATSKTVIL